MKFQIIRCDSRNSTKNSINTVIMFQSVRKFKIMQDDIKSTPCQAAAGHSNVSAQTRCQVFFSAQFVICLGCRFSDRCYLGGIVGLYWDNGEANGTYYSTIGILGLYWGNIWIMEKKIEPTIV